MARGIAQVELESFIYSVERVQSFEGQCWAETARDSAVFPVAGRAVNPKTVGALVG